MKNIAITLLALASVVHAHVDVPGQVNMTFFESVWNPEDLVYETKPNVSNMGPLPSSGSGVFIYNGVLQKPELWPLDTVISYSTSTKKLGLDLTGKSLADINLSVTPSDINGLNTALSLKLDASSAFSGSYLDLTNRPTVPTNTNQLTNGAGFITGINSSAVTTALGFTPYSASNPNGYTSNTGTVTSAGITSSNLTVTGSPITGSGSIAVSLPNVGTAGTYGNVTTDSQGRVIAGKRTETYSGTTNASGVVAVTFATAFSSAPNIQANLINGADNQNLRITSITSTGFTVLARTRTDVVGLLPTWANAPNLAVDILITEK